MADAELGNKFASVDLDNIRPFIGCHNGCLARIFQGKDISCAVNPACGRELTYGIDKASKKKNILVVGAALGGMEVARVCAIRGHIVDLYEKTDKLGGAFIATGAKERKLDTPGFDNSNVTYATETLLHTEVKGENVHLIGDAQKPENVMKAIWDAYKIAKNI